MEKYTKEDIVAFARKDRMIVAQTSLDHAIETMVAIPNGLKEYSIKGVLDIANQYFDWVFSKADQNVGNTNPVPVPADSNVSGNSNPEEKITPVPTTTQLKWLTLIKDNYGYTQEQVFATCKKFPNTKDDAVKMVKQLKSS